MDPVDPRDRHAEALGFPAAIDELKKLRPLLQEVVVMHSQANRHQDVADAMGLSRQRVAGRTKSDSPIVLAWRRAALVIDDFRQNYGWSSRTDAIGAIPIDPVARRSYHRAERAIADVAEPRERRKGAKRER